MARKPLWVGLDVGADQTTACVIDAQGQIVVEQPVPTRAPSLHAFLRPYKRRISLIGLETGPYSPHLVRSLRKLGYRVAMFESRQVSKFLAIRQNKTDKNDARGLAEIARLGREAVSEVHIKSAECQRLRSALVTRQRLLILRCSTEATIRSLFRLNGGSLKKFRSAIALRRHAHAELKRLRKTEKIDLTGDVAPLLDLCEAIRAYLERLDKQFETLAREHPICRRFLEIPGIGPICALSFYSAIDDPSRFSRTADVGAYLGMVPRVRQSGMTSQSRRISKRGSRMTRTHLTTAAVVHLRYAESALQEWGTRLGERIGRPRARLAVARKLAVVMMAMWKSGEPYRAGCNEMARTDLTSAVGMPAGA